MPRYEIEHVCFLTEGQKDELAEAITRIHSDTFTTPKLFVNVRITDVSQQDHYVAGKRRRSNGIYAFVRHGSTRTQEHYESVAKQIVAEWDKIAPLPQIQRSAPPQDRELRVVMFFGGITASYEGGFMVPAAGQDKQWLADNLAAFQAKADDGNEEFKDMIADCRQRGLIQ